MILGCNIEERGAFSMENSPTCVEYSHADLSQNLYIFHVETIAPRLNTQFIWKFRLKSIY